MQCKAVVCSTVQCSAVQCSAVQMIECCYPGDPGRGAEREDGREEGREREEEEQEEEGGKRRERKEDGEDSGLESLHTSSSSSLRLQHKETGRSRNKGKEYTR